MSLLSLKGEIAIQIGDPISSQLPQLVPRLVHIVCGIQLPKPIRENASITLGRLGLILPNEMAQFISEFLEGWFHAMRLILNVIQCLVLNKNMKP